MTAAFGTQWRGMKERRERWRDLSPMRRREALYGFAFISPWFIGLLLFSLFPFVASFVLSFTRYDVINPPVWIGLDNYNEIFSGDSLFLKSLGNTALYVVGSVAIRIVLAFSLAMLLNSRVRFLGVWRTLFYIPSTVPIVAISMVWIYILNARYGLLNWFLSLLGQGRIRWLSSPSYAMSGLLVMSTTWVGVTMIIFLAGLQNIPEEYYDAARIDGANWLQRLRRVTLPLLTPTIFLNVLINIISAFQVFNQVFIMTQGGPRDATRTYMLHLYNHAFEFLPPQMGYASALAWILFIILFVFTAIVVLTSDRWVFYSD